MRYLLSPEFFWLCLYGAAVLLARLNNPPGKAMDDLIERCWFWIPAFSLLVFALWYLPVAEKRYLLLRVWIFGLLGGHFVLERALNAYSQQGPGIGMGYLAGLMLEVLVLLLGTIWVWVKF